MSLIQLQYVLDDTEERVQRVKGVLSEVSVQSGQTEEDSKKVIGACQDVIDKGKELSNELKKRNLEIDKAAEKIKALPKLLADGAQELGTAVGEFVKLTGDGSPMMTAVNWSVYHVQKQMADTKTVAKETLDFLADMVDKKLPGFSFYLNHFVAEAAEGKLTLDQLLAKMLEFSTSAGATMLNVSGWAGNLEDFNRKLKKAAADLKEAEKEATAAGEKVKKAAEEVQNVLAGISATGASGDLGSGGGAGTGHGIVSGLTNALKAARR